MIRTFNPVTLGRRVALTDIVAAVRPSGFDALEFDVEEVAALVAAHGLDEVRRRMEGVRLLSFGLPVEWRRSEDEFSDGLGRLAGYARLAVEVGALSGATWVMPSEGRPAGEYAAVATERLAAMARVLGDHGLELGLEYVSPWHLRPDPSQVWFCDLRGALAVVEDLRARSRVAGIGVVLDAFHWHISGGAVGELAASDIVHVHVSDAPRRPDGAAVPRPNLQDKERELPGRTGVVDLPGLFRDLAAIGYRSGVAVEVFSATLADLDVAEVVGQADAALGRFLGAAGGTG